MKTITSTKAVENSIRVLVVEDHAIVREGVCSLLRNELDIEVVGGVGSGEEAVNFVRGAAPDVVVMDIGLPGMSGLDATRKLKEDHPDLNILALTMYSDEQFLIGMIEAGAAGYLRKQSMVSELVQAVRAVSRGQFFLQPSATRAVINSFRKTRDQKESGDSLTVREKEILRLIGQGLTSKEISRHLFLSPRTVENYRARILAKLQVKNCSEAVSTAIGQGIIESPI